jgi:Putative beta barrel porin-7 (BBP7)
MRQFAARISMVCAAAILTAALFDESARAADLPFLKAPPSPPSVGAFWIELEYLAWTVKGDHLPPLVTTSPAGTPLGVAGVLGAPGATVLFGGSDVNDDWRSGGRVRAGHWFDPGHTRGVEASFFALGDASTGFAAGSDAAGNPIVTRPFFNALTNLQDAAIVAFPATAAGSITIGETSRLLGAGALYRQALGTWAGERVSGVVGYRYLHASDRLSIASASTFLAPPFTGMLVNVNDTFEASSNFHGLDLGLVGEFDRGPWSFEWRAKVALGANFNAAQINGSTTTTLAGVTQTAVGGILTGPSNIGNFSQTRFAVVPDLELKAGYQFAPQWRGVVGYEVLYWTNVQRAGGLIDTMVNPTPAGGGPQRPQVLLDTSSLLAQGFTIGVRHGF